MNCAEIKEKLFLFCFNELTAEELEVIHAHLELCKRCAQEHHTIIGILKCIAEGLVDEPIPPSVRERLMTSLEDTAPSF